MNQSERFNDILNACLDRVLKGETVEECLRSYPDQAGELEPLLRTAVAAKAASAIQPRPEFKARARYEFQSALREMEVRKVQRRSIFSWRPQWQSGWAIAIVAVIVVVLGGGSVVAASSRSMPDDALYAVKLAAEQAQLAVTPSDLGQAELNSKFADRRAEEIVYVASKGDAEEVQIIAQRLDTNLENITNLTAGESGRESNGQSDDTQQAATGGGPGGGPVDSFVSTPSTENGQAPMMGAASATATDAAPEKSAPAPLLNAQAPMLAPDPNAVPTGTPAPMPAAVPAPVAPPAEGVEQTPSVTNDTDSSFRSMGKNINVGGTQNSQSVRSTEREKIREIIVNNFADRQALLEEALKNASPEVRPVIRQAIANSLAEYEKALSNLE